jgi:23S rRNA pseudouridine1911/1915/1917 synthase
MTAGEQGTPRPHARQDTRQAARHVVAAGEAPAGARLDRLLAERLPEMSRSRLKALIEDGRVTLVGSDTAVLSPSARVKAGQSFAIIVPDSVAAEPEGQAIPLDILYEDADVLVLDKPAGLVVHPAPGNQEGTLVNALIHHCGASLTGIGGVRRPGIVHRLDKDTSGVMVVAKTEAAHASLSAQFKAHTVERAYRAVVWGRPLPAIGEVDAAIGRDPHNRKRMAARRQGKAALTRYQTLATYRGVASLVECRLATGRTHQIRVHMASKGHPVIGDPTYGGGLTAARKKALPAAAAAAVEALPGQALHAASLGFQHPKSAEWVRFATKIPSYMKVLVDSLERI